MRIAPPLQMTANDFPGRNAGELLCQVPLPNGIIGLPLTDEETGV